MTFSIDTTTDTHVHTSLCNHAVGTMEQYVRAAIERGLRRIVFLEHLELGINYFHRTWLRETDFRQYFQEGGELRKRFCKQIDIWLGVEVGFNPDRIEELQSWIDRYPFAYIGLSYHFYDTGREHLNMLSHKEHNLRALERIGLQKIVSEYFDALLLAIDTLPCDKVCHLDAVLRHHPEVYFAPEHWQQIDRLLNKMARKKILLEVNTSGYAHRNAPYPSIPLIRRAQELGVALVAGSDAHHPDQVGRFFSRLTALTS